MTDGQAPGEVGIVLYPGAQMAAVLGLTDLFRIANRFADDLGPARGAPLRVTHWSLEGGEVSCTYRSEPGGAPRPAILILPPTLMGTPDPRVRADVGRWLKGQHAQGVQLVAVCSGIFLVAGTGLLDGRAVSTHRDCAGALADLHPGIAVDTDRRIIDHADILTAGGFMAWVDVGLVLVERLLGAPVRERTARFVLSDSATRSAPHFAGFAPRQAHDDMAVRRAQEFIHARDGQGVSLAEAAAVARLERRTFLRRFASATGLTPIEYCRAVRIARARELLESGNLSLKEIAGHLGYGDQSAFSRAFRRAQGVAPGAFRKRHGGHVAGWAEVQRGSSAGL